MVGLSDPVLLQDDCETRDRGFMKIGIIGSGNVGSTVARLLVGAGHPIAISNSRGPETLKRLIGELGPGARATTAAEAARFGDVVLVAIPFGRYRELPAGELRSRIVVDASNYHPERDGEIDFGGLTSSELLAQALPGARLVKAFNTMRSRTLATEGTEDHQRRLALFVAGDDDVAKAAVSELIRGIGFVPVDTGSLAEGGRRQQPGSPIFDRLLTRAEALEAVSQA